MRNFSRLSWRVASSRPGVRALGGLYKLHPPRPNPIVVLIQLLLVLILPLRMDRSPDAGQPHAKVNLARIFSRFSLRPS